jgi:hypothetical protein
MKTIYSHSILTYTKRVDFFKILNKRLSLSSFYNKNKKEFLNYEYNYCFFTITFDDVVFEFNYNNSFYKLEFRSIYLNIYKDGLIIPLSTLIDEVPFVSPL